MPGKIHKLSIAKIREELVKLTDIELLKKEADRLAKEFAKMDLQRLTAPAQAHIKKLEKKYEELVQLIHTVQTQLDQELKNLAKTFQRSRKDVEKRVVQMKKAAEGQKKKIRKAINKRLKKNTQASKKKTRKVAKNRISKKKKTAIRKKTSKKVGTNELTGTGTL